MMSRPAIATAPSRRSPAGPIVNTCPPRTSVTEAPLERASLRAASFTAASLRDRDARIDELVGGDVLRRHLRVRPVVEAVLDVVDRGLHPFHVEPGDRVA